MSLSPEVAALIAELRAAGSEADRAGQARYGIETSRSFGVRLPVIKAIAKRLKRNHALAAALWASGFHEARMLAFLIDDPKAVTPQQMDAWAGDFDSWDICDGACSKLFVKTPYVEEKIRAFARDEREYVRRAGFALLAAYTVHGKKVADERFRAFLPLIEKYATDPRNLVKKAVNWALRQIGKHSAALHAPALELAERLAASPDKTARWIGKDAAKELRDPFQLDRLGLSAADLPPA